MKDQLFLADVIQLRYKEHINFGRQPSAIPTSIVCFLTFILKSFEPL